jgi:two-component system response regulator PilR (NtrC family)
MRNVSVDQTLDREEFCVNSKAANPKVVLASDAEVSVCDLTLPALHVPGDLIDQTIIGQSAAVQHVKRFIRQVGPARANVLITGESGTGKELIARMLHELGEQKGQPFIAVNCGALSEALIESELFGHQRGSFTGAVADKKGLFELADGGVIFLDEIGEMPLSLQVKLLRVLQEKTFRRVGGVEDIRVSIRIIAATNRNLEQMIRDGQFREDLFYRLGVIQVRSPSLRERMDDIELLAGVFAARHAETYGSRRQLFDHHALTAMRNYAWPGNIRELQGVVERALTLDQNPIVGIESLPNEIANCLRRGQSPQQAARKGAQSEGEGTAAGPTRELRIPYPDWSKNEGVDLEQILAEVEQKFMMKALKYSGGVQTRSADRLGVSFRSFRYRLKKLGLEVIESVEEKTRELMEQKKIAG